MWVLLKSFGLEKIAAKGVLTLAVIIGLLVIVTVSYMAGKRDESNTQELKRKDAIISGLRADIELQKQLTAKAEADRNELAIQRNMDESALAEYAARLKERANENGTVKNGQTNQCRNTCAIDNDFLNVLGNRRMRK